MRPQANYQRSLDLLEQSAKSGRVKVKSGIMVGLGESSEELIEVLVDLRNVGVHFVTIGQYLRPSEQH